MEEDSWVCISEDDDSSHSFTDSDKIDSETEAELYSKIHHVEDLPSVNCLPSKSLNGQTDLFINPLLVNESLNIDKEENVQASTEMNENLFQKQMSQDARCSVGKRKSSDMFADYIDGKQDSNSTKKFKSSFEGKIVSDAKVLSHEHENVLNCSKIKNVKSKSDSFSKNKLHKKDTHFNDSSDSDSSVILTEPEPQGKGDIKTNLFDDTIYLSSSDSEPHYYSSPVKRKVPDLKNLSMPNLKMDKNSKGIWSINNEDLQRPRKYSRRYHEYNEVRCSNCNEKGHTFRICRQPKAIKCFLCGGGHNSARCVNRICSNCYVFGHDSRTCRKKPMSLYCSLCRMKGHIIENCPDLWRRFHLTTNESNIQKGNKAAPLNGNLYCFKCGEGGHFGGMCPSSFPSRSCFSTWPCVISYNDPKPTFGRRVRIFGNLDERNRRAYDVKVNVSNPKNVPKKFNANRKAGKKKKKNGFEVQ